MGVDKAFSELDTKGDNKISPEELAAFFKVSKQPITYYSIIESDIFTCDYFDAKSKFEDMAENGILTLPMPPQNNHGI